ncbi:hypothetical protein [Deinococcus cellulosilyticus]|uniref:Uncharacterized protein n=1 Tax=Deinococcus cellulosilyticus (strain DSM 18568 / NBRC 106333 / KACC 11606 / 5516J-15) TaxID=1223518 RepID=A0A511N6F5_DEIC1|nr:hypothetical protein [Deinococcus cellulosilyticus]GEM48037.1 hypothetical protein DC3_36720 [Deinococcus cellulosilyticus NBRC 106333 = KACC 11606]
MKKILIAALSLLCSAQAMRYGENLAFLKPTDMCVGVPMIVVNDKFDSTSGLPEELQRVLLNESTRLGLNIADTTMENCVGFVYLTVNAQKTTAGFIYSAAIEVIIQQANMNQVNSPYSRTSPSAGKVMYSIIWDNRKLGAYDREEMLRPLLIGDGLTLFADFAEDWKAYH